MAGSYLLRFRMTPIVAVAFLVLAATAGGAAELVPIGPGGKIGTMRLARGTVAEAGAKLFDFCDPIITPAGAISTDVLARAAVPTDLHRLRLLLHRSGRAKGILEIHAVADVARRSPRSSAFVRNLGQDADCISACWRKGRHPARVGGHARRAEPRKAHDSVPKPDECRDNRRDLGLPRIQTMIWRT